MDGRMVDVIVPVHNQEKLISDTIESVCRQTYPFWQLILVDDGSTDETSEVIARHAAGDKRIHFLGDECCRAGACRTRNRGFRYGNSPYVLYLDSDDLLAEHCLETRIAFLDRDVSLDFVLGQTLVFDSVPYDLTVLWNTPSLTPECDLLRLLRQDMPWHTISPLWRRQALERLGGWNEQLAAFQDWELHIRACHLGLQYGSASDAPDSFYRRPKVEGSSVACGYFTPEKVRAREVAIISVSKLEGFLADRRRRAHVEGFCLRNALQLLEAGQPAMATRFLLQTIRHGLFRNRSALVAAASLLRGRNWRYSTPIRRLQAGIWSAECRIDPWEKVSWAGGSA